MWQILKNDCVVEIKHPGKEDAQGILDMMRTVYGESEFLTRYPEEFDLSVEDEIRWISRFDHQKSTMVIAKANNQVIASASVNQVSDALRLRHRCTFGISVIEEYQGLGVGRMLTEQMITFAKNAGYEQMELEVVARNEKAIALYESVGFEIVGRKTRAFKHKDGRYDDEYVMIYRW